VVEAQREEMHVSDAGDHGARRVVRHFTLLIIPSLLIATACQDATEPAVPSELEIVAGAAQSGEAAGRVAIAPAVRVLDQRSRPMANVEVTFTVVEGEGRVSAGSVRSDASGEASAVEWTLGTRAGRNTLNASVAGVAPAVFTATARAGQASKLTIVIGDGQTATVGSAVALVPVVRITDAHDNPVAATLVRFSAAGGSNVSKTLASSDEQGIASAGTWTLGTTAGEQVLEAKLESGPSIALHAVALPGPAAGLMIVSGNGQSATVATAVADAPTVRVVDAFGNAVSNVDVAFQVGSGSGDVDGVQSTYASSSSDPAGIARVGRWTLGTRAGPNTLRATIAGVSAQAVFTATGLAADPVSLVKHAGDSQSAPVNTEVSVAPAVRVLDAHGNGVPGIAVSFAANAGGVVTGAPTDTDDGGVAAVVSWQLGSAEGANTLTASVEGVGTLTFTANATPAGSGTGSGSGGPGGTPPGGYDLQITFTTTVSLSMQSEFYVAAGRWASAITGDLPNVPVSLPANACGMMHPPIAQTIDDLLILVRVGPMDGPGNILGSAGPCVVRSAGGLPVIGVMNLDADDLAFLEANGRLGDVIAHEIGHIIGIGTRWGSHLVGAGSTDPHFTGPNAVAAFHGNGSFGYTGAPVPVENTGGPGTRDGHWRENVMTNELMTGWLNLTYNALSDVTIGALADIGYTVNVDAADGYSAGISDAAQDATGTPRPPIEMKEAPIGIVPIAVDARGRRVSLRGIER
jgi:hypothetical protein